MIRHFIHAISVFTPPGRVSAKNVKARLYSPVSRCMSRQGRLIAGEVVPPRCPECFAFDEQRHYAMPASYAKHAVSHAFFLFCRATSTFAMRRDVDTHHARAMFRLEEITAILPKIFLRETLPVFRCRTERERRPRRDIVEMMMFLMPSSALVTRFFDAARRLLARCRCLPRADVQRHATRVSKLIRPRTIQPAFRRCRVLRPRRRQPATKTTATRRDMTIFRRSRYALFSQWSAPLPARLCAR